MRGEMKEIEIKQEKGYPNQESPFVLGQFNGIDVTLVIYKHSQDTTNRSRNQLSTREIISQVITSLKYMTGTNHLANCRSSPEEYAARRHREEHF